MQYLIGHRITVSETILQDQNYVKDPLRNVNPQKNSPPWSGYSLLFITPAHFIPTYHTQSKSMLPNLCLPSFLSFSLPYSFMFSLSLEVLLIEHPSHMVFYFKSGKTDDISTTAYSEISLKLYIDLINCLINCFICHKSNHSTQH